METKLVDSKNQSDIKYYSEVLIQQLHYRDLKIWIQFPLNGNYFSFLVLVFPFNVITKCAVNCILKA